MNEDILFDLSKDFLEVINKYNFIEKDFAMMYVKGSMSIIDLESEGVKEAMAKKEELFIEQNPINDITKTKNLQEK